LQIDITLESVFKAKDDVVSCELDDGAALLDLSKNVYYGLNPVASEVWAAIQAPCSVADIGRVVSSKFDTADADVSSDVIGLLQHLHEAGLVDRVDAPAP